MDRPNLPHVHVRIDRQFKPVIGVLLVRPVDRREDAEQELIRDLGACLKGIVIIRDGTPQRALGAARIRDRSKTAPRKSGHGKHRCAGSKD